MRSAAFIDDKIADHDGGHDMLGGETRDRRT